MDKQKPATFDSTTDEKKNKPPSGARQIWVKNKKTQSNSSYQKRCIVQNFLLIWLDTDKHHSKHDYQNIPTQLRSIVNNVNIFTTLSECIKFLVTVDDMRIFLIVGDTLAKLIVSVVHDIPQLDVIYIFSSNNKSKHELWTKRWEKVKGVHTIIPSICESLQQVVKQCNQNSIAMSFLEGNKDISNQNLEQFDTSFIYTLIFKEVLLQAQYNEHSIKYFILFWRYYYIGNTFILNVIAEFECNYRPELSIYWYTRVDFVYQMLNQALHTSEANIIFYLSSFLHNLKQQIIQLHQQQIDNYHGRPFIVYRGQSLSSLNFKKLLKRKGGFISFNNFLSTTENEEASLIAAKDALVQTNMVGILFKMLIDPSISSVPFASIREVSYSKREDEILFSMHTMFRVGEITKIEKRSELYQVELKLIADDDPQLRTVIEHIREETGDYAGWRSVNQSLNKLILDHKSEVCYDVLLDPICDEYGRAHYYKKFGHVKDNEDHYAKAISCYDKALEICERTLPSNHLNFATVYNELATVYKNKGEYSKVLSILEKVLEIQKEALPSNHPDMAILYNNIGVIYSYMKEYSKALSSHEKAVLIYEKTLVPNHPLLATFYDNVAAVYYDMEEYSEALASHEKALNMRKKAVPPNHHDLSSSYNKIGVIYRSMTEYSKALTSHEEALEIQTKLLYPNYYDVIIACDNMALLYYYMGEYLTTISIYEKELEIQKQVLSVDHPSLAFTYDNVAKTYRNVEEYSKALSFHEKALEIHRKTLPSMHPNLANSYNDIGEVYEKTGEHAKALSSHKKALEIRKETLPPNHTDLAISYTNIGEVYQNMGEHLNALSSYEKALEIRKEILPQNHPDLATSYTNIGEVYQNMGDYLNAASSHVKAIEIFQKVFPANHPFLVTIYHDIALIYAAMGEHSQARSIKKKLRKFLQKTVS